MNLVCVGLSHATTPVAARERFTRSAADLKELLFPRPALDEYAILSTCNRMEVYACLSGSEDTALIELLESISGMERNEFAGCLYRYEGLKAVEHLSRVAAGLDSLVIGEGQILGQVAQAYETARRQGIAGLKLGGLFRTAIRTGKRAHAETDIGRNPVSVSSVAVRLAREAFGDLTAARVLIIGAGEMAGLAIQSLRDQGVRDIAIVNRTIEPARELAQRWGARTLGLDQLDEALAQTDLVIASSGAPYVVVTPALLGRAGAGRREAPLVFIDIAVPRNVSPEVARLAHVRYYDIDDLDVMQNEGRAARERVIPEVQAIVAEELAAYREWERQQQVAPVIAGLHAKAEAIRKAEVERTLRRWPQAGEAERERIESLTAALVKRLLHDATVQLKAEAGEEQAVRHAAVLEELFDLEGQS